MVRILFALAFLFPLACNAQEDDIDQLITNPKMRAESGSKSKYSLASTLTYSGGSLNQPFGKTRPNLTGATGTTDFPSLVGQVSGKYNISKITALLGGVGVRWVAPFAGGADLPGYEGKRLDAADPYVIYQYLYRVGGLQSNVQAKQTLYTASDLTKRGFVTSFNLSQNSVYEIGTTGLSLGFNANLNLGWFNKEDAESRKGQSDYTIAFTPNAEYRFTETVNARLETNAFVYEHLRSRSNALTFNKQDVSQTLSLGVAVTRDVFVSPGVSFVASNLRLDRTQWSVSATINL